MATVYRLNSSEENILKQYPDAKFVDNDWCLVINFNNDLEKWIKNQIETQGRAEFADENGFIFCATNNQNRIYL